MPGKSQQQPRLNRPIGSMPRQTKKKKKRERNEFMCTVIEYCDVVNVQERLISLKRVILNLECHPSPPPPPPPPRLTIIGVSCHKYTLCRDKTRLLSRQKSYLWQLPPTIPPSSHTPFFRYTFLLLVTKTKTESHSQRVETACVHPSVRKCLCC